MNWLSHFQPHDDGVEQQLIACLVAFPGLMPKVIYRIESEDFFRPFFRDVFRAIEQLWRSGRAITPESISIEIVLNGTAEDYSDAVKVCERVNGFLSWYAHNMDGELVGTDAPYLRNFSLLRRLTDFCHNTLDQIYVPDGDTADDVLDKAYVSLCKIGQWYTSLEPKRKRLEELRSMPYSEYLRSPEWKTRRDAQVDTDGNACRICGSPDNLNVHHRTYERRGIEAPGDLITLCQPCHQLFHDNGKLAKPEG